MSGNVMALQKKDVWQGKKHKQSGGQADVKQILNLLTWGPTSRLNFDLPYLP